MRIRNLNYEVLKHSVSIFFEYSIAAWIMGGCGLSFMCLF